MRPPLAVAAEAPKDLGTPENRNARLELSTMGDVQSLHNIKHVPWPIIRSGAFIGPSGCGKSTLLRVLNRMYALYPKTAGRRRSAHRRPRHFWAPWSDVAGAAVTASAWCFQKPTPFSDAGVRQCGIRACGWSAAFAGAELKSARGIRRWRDAAIWGRGQGQAARRRAGVCRAASSRRLLHRTGPSR